ncbi:hypothetical protein BOW53_04570 [Solemya pervernicosa gill symbiont]|uniref:histidine kinase n=2 Tax=Gammaproteobacteria incertae sedis TaxID=118884 RepID=A0A1T2L825_9GAMM|nr:ATP-binding protein [Candidatus Reidiella endopervernicosa]OOZ41257.1 hypothetical protein BOW53_04570 [Solemya pervernicosa gill symbiont]QKQ25258.1 HAMP domain-containing protein [Candidatus Reidiella endopervernicosa]
MRFVRYLFSGTLPALLLFAMLLTSLYLLSESTQNSEQFSQLYIAMLALNALILVILLGLIIYSVIKLIRGYRNRAPGARLTMRMVVMFVILAVTPVTIVYLFSVQFLMRGIDSWFNVQVESALEDAIELSRSSLDARMKELLHDSEVMGGKLENVSDTFMAVEVDDLRVESGADELTLLAQNGHIVASSSSDPTRIVPYQPDDVILSYVRNTGPYVGLDAINDLLYIRVVVPVTGVVDGGMGGFIMQVLYPVAERLDRLARNVQDAYGRYKALAYLREPLKFSFIVTLSLVLLLSILSAVLAAFSSARRLVAPIGDLAEGTRAVAAGDYNKRIPEIGGDELGILVRSFNVMTKRIAHASDEARRSQQEAQSQHAYLEAVLSRLTSGVVVLDSELYVRTINEMAVQFLKVDRSALLDQPFTQLAELHPGLEDFVAALTPHFDQGGSEWREEVTLFSGGGRQVLMCRGTTLPDEDGGAVGHVIVFDDITNLVQAQRDAAWGEVARRLAHEIKNPLTPIQLSAERLRHKFLNKMEEKDAAVLDRSTHTIVQQVDAMKAMVNAFSDYARAPKIELQRLDLNTLVYDVLELYRGPGSGVAIEKSLADALPEIEADAGRLRQLVHNLLKNAIEALEDVDTPVVTVRTACMQKEDCRYIELRFEDNGLGFPEELLGQLFEPYVTTKTKGTGLGLAIVKKIVEEHGGVIRGENLEPNGAAIVIQLPVMDGKSDREEQA